MSGTPTVESIVLKTEHSYISLDKSEESNEGEYKVWSHTNTKLLINYYESLRKEVGSARIRNLKKLWTIIAQQFKEEYNMKFTPENCENRWRVIVRNYKKHINNNKIGRMRKHFEYIDEMDKIFARKKTMHPVLLLDSRTVDMPPLLSQNTYTGPIDECSDAVTNIVNTPSAARSLQQHLNTLATSKKLRLIVPKTNKTNIPEFKNKTDKMSYHDQKLLLYKEHLQLEREKLKVRQERNELLRKQNEIMKACVDKGLAIKL